ncbi:MAG: gamma-glutamyl-gamma-aminobutyrate hydrolase family protein, partial [Candidatus Bathyarchaeota archaeon]|nr:gamma-glutamyl-gamma-aminobutyrate hydrolase family protein [Candidatus Bathyarchaeota archaeon]
MKPVIGITSSYNNTDQSYILPSSYVLAVERGGGIPLLLPPTLNIDVDRHLALVDGIILTGGVDVDPRFYDEDPIPQMGIIDPLRDDYELKLTRRIIETRKPVLAICRGCQILNVAAGGKLWQDINSQVTNSIKHNQQAPTFYASHTVRMAKDSKLSEIYGIETIGVNTFHHQGIKARGSGLTAAAWANDETIEAIEGSGKFTLGVQWHPER